MLSLSNITVDCVETKCEVWVRGPAFGEENYDEVRAWFGMGPRGVPEVVTRSHVLSFVGLTVVSAAACDFLSPDFGLTSPASSCSSGCSSPSS